MSKSQHIRSSGLTALTNYPIIHQLNITEAILSSRTLKKIFYTLTILALLANIFTYILYTATSLSFILLSIGIFDLLFVVPVLALFGLYVLLIGEGQKVKTETLTQDLFKDVKIST